MFGDVLVFVRIVGGGEYWNLILLFLKNVIVVKMGEKNVMIGIDYVELLMRVIFLVRFGFYCFVIFVVVLWRVRNMKMMKLYDLKN